MSAGALLKQQPLGFPYPTIDPFLFCVYHIDDYPPGNEKLEAPVRGNGQDFDWRKPFRMYHGEKVPGFPCHPHRGQETITATIDGLIDHADSYGNHGRYGQGDLQWMTAGKGIQHSEMFPLIEQEKNNFGRFFQIWLNLPKKNKMAEPSFVMHWAENIEKFVDSENGFSVTVWAGEFRSVKGQEPPPSSWAQDPNNDVGVQHIVIEPNGAMTLPAAKGGSETGRMLYFFEGKQLGFDDMIIDAKQALTVDAGKAIKLSNPSEDKKIELLLLQGKPINEPVVQQGPFVMNTRDEIRQAYMDFQKTQFGGWHWESRAVVHDFKSRFAVVGLGDDKVAMSPPTQETKESSNKTEL